MFSPEKVIEWYNKKPKWGKILFFVIFIIAIVLSVLWWSLKKPKKEDQTFSENIEEMDSYFEGKIDEAKKKDDDIVQKIKIEQDKRKKLEEERLKKLQEAQNAENKINEADNIHDIVNTINENRRKRRRRKT